MIWFSSYTLTFILFYFQTVLPKQFVFVCCSKKVFYSRNKESYFLVEFKKNEHNSKYKFSLSYFIYFSKNLAADVKENNNVK